jgi:hypothetical protein
LTLDKPPTGRNATKSTTSLNNDRIKILPEPDYQHQMIGFQRQRR